MGRLLLALLLAVPLALAIVANAAVAALSEAAPARAAQLWPTHPDVETSLAMIDIAKATYARRPVGESVFATMADAAVKAPLAPEPFLVRGVQAQLAGNAELARRAFAAAQLRDPRSLPARYFLADLMFRTGDVRGGLKQVAVLARLAPGGLDSMAPYIAAYARDRAHWPELRALFREDSAGIEDAALLALAKDPANADLIVALATRQRVVRSSWLPVLLTNLVEAGAYAKARAIWGAAFGVRDSANTLIHDAGFSDTRTAPPFNWRLATSTVGLAERQPGGRLHVIYYGQEDGILAQQLLLLEPGAYRLSMRVAGDLERGRALSWSLRCGKSQTPLASLPLDAAARGLAFQVPAGCAGQWLELSGKSSDISQQSDVTISGLALTAERPRG